jgi:hypothetical protein
LTTDELLAARTRQLQECDDDLAAFHTVDTDTATSFEVALSQCNFDFKPGTLVIVRKSSIETDPGCKPKPRYVGPMVVIRRTPQRCIPHCGTRWLSL